MQLLVLAAAIINARRPLAPSNNYWDDVVAQPFVDNGVLVDLRQPVIPGSSFSLSTGRFGGQCIAMGDGGFYRCGNNAFSLTGDFTIEGHTQLTTQVRNNNYLFDTGTNGLVVKLVGGQWQVTYTNVGEPLILAVGAPAVVGQWYHFALVRQGALLKFYINGISYGQATFTAQIESTLFVWGNRGAATAFNWWGKLDNLRISLRARYNANFTPPMSPFPIGGPEASFDPFWDKTILAIQGGTVGGTALDLTGRGPAITVGANASVSAEQKRFGDASLKVSGGSNFRVADTDDRFDFETTDFTVEGWVYPTAVGGTVAHVMGRGGTGTSGGYRIVLNSLRPQIYHSVSNGTWVPTTVVSNSTLPIGRWTHLALTRTGNLLKLYVNGKLLVSQVPTAALNASTLAFTIGANVNSAEPFVGHIDSVRVTRACRYADNFTPKLASDFAVRGNTGNEGVADYDTYGANNVFSAQFADSFADHRQSALYTVLSQTTFDATRLLFGKPTLNFVTGANANLSYAAARPLISAEEFTVESWVNSTYSDGNASFGIASQWGLNGWGLVIRAGVIRFYYNTTQYISSTTSGATGEWLHVAVTRRGGVITLWVNGKAEATVNYTGAFSIATTLQVGRVSTTAPTAGFRVNVADLRISNGISRYNANFTPPTKAHPVSTLAA
jgi:hypothetical protein